MISFLVYSATGNELTPATIFSALALFNAVRIPLMLLPGIIAMVTDAKVSLGRMQSLLLADELEELPPIDFDAKHAIEVRDGAFEWEVPPPKEKEMTKQEKKEFKKKEKEEKRISKRMSKRQSQVQEKSPAIQEEKKTPSISSESDDAAVTKLSDTTLAAAGESKAEPALAPPNSMIDNLNLRVNRGELLAIVGPVGSGKSSVLGALVGEMKRNAGQVVFGGTLGYCPQTAWIQNATVRDNITFGLPYDEAKYRSILRSCALEQDLSILPDGDQTEIGERGVNLSGGQKQRINIARAVYFDSDIVLLDDPFSALDSHTGRAVFENCLLGSLKGKTRVLVTHQLHFLSSVDRIIVMNRGQVVEVGSYRELMEANGDFAELMREYGGAQDEEEVVEAESAEIVALKKAKTREVKDDKQGKGQALMTGEERATGAVNNNVYLAYFRAGGVLACIWLLIAMVLSQVMRVGSDLWLSWWSSGNFGLSNGIYMGVYAAWGGAQALFNLISGVSFAIIGIVAARKLHNAAVDSVIRAPSSFYDTTPLGRIINRFSKDVDAVDFTLANSFRMFMVTLLGIFSTFILISVIFPIYLAPLAPLLVFYWYFQAYYRSTSRELKRLDSIARSPLYAHFSESLTGLSTLRAYRVQDRFIDLNQKHQDASNRAFYLTLIIQRWLAIRLDVIANLLTFFVMLFAVIFRNTVDPGLVGLVISYSLQVSGSLNWTVRQAAEVETNMNSVERLDHYAKHIDQEPPAEIPSRKPPPTWPSSGSITFTDVELAYRPGLPRVLHGISFHINGGEKIGIVGRTGSGKSTIMMALFRIVELSGGNIHVDDVDIGSIGLADLRGRIAIIPQDPTLFNGTFRSNLDPFGTHTDQELWESLESADLKQYVSEQASGLDAEVYEGGENLSAGQRQLLCLARAMLRKPRILVMDEATASVDLKTDALLQRAIRNDFNCTILTIAHRLNTVIDYDRVLVLDNGTIKEFDSPGRLLENPESVFSKMVMETGAANSTLLKSQAKY
jgi:ABC-type multidrug transport system fused ATPase/permease subunit